MAQKRRKALFIGINQYDKGRDLSCCVEDASQMKKILSTNGDGSANFNCQILINESQTIVKTAIKKLFSGMCEDALLFFSGHGSFNTDIDEGVLIAKDYSEDNEGIRIDDILYWAKTATDIQNKTIILDCCNAGFAGEQRNLNSNVSAIGEGITLMAACRKEEDAIEQADHGLFTGLILQGLKGGAANLIGHITPASLYSFVDNALGPWHQRPVIKTNTSQFISLRDVEPLVPLEILRNLPKWFEYPEHKFQLDPSFEPTEKEQYNQENGAIFAQLQKCNRHSLVEPVGVEHMYDAAINFKTCQLTEIGKYYRSLALKRHF